MTNRYSLAKDKCEVNLNDFYEIAATTAGYTVTDKTRFDCRKICITTPIMEALWRYYSENGSTGEEIATIMLQFGPKANLDGNDYEFTIEDGFVTEES